MTGAPCRVAGISIVHPSFYNPCPLRLVVDTGILGELHSFHNITMPLWSKLLSTTGHR